MTSATLVSTRPQPPAGVLATKTAEPRAPKDRYPATHRFRHPGPSIMCDHATWLSVRKAGRPARHRDYILTNVKTGATTWVRLQGWSATQWRVISMEGARATFKNRAKRLSRRLWRVTWLIRSIPLTKGHLALTDAKVVEDWALAAVILRAIDKRGPLPAFPAGVEIPQVVALPYPNAW